MTFGERLKLALKEHDTNQTEFGKKVQLTTCTIWRLCNDRRVPTFKHLQRILYALPMTNARWLITGLGDGLVVQREIFQQERKEENEVQ